MRKLILVALLTTAVALPGVASAQSRQDLQLRRDLQTQRERSDWQARRDFNENYRDQQGLRARDRAAAARARAGNDDWRAYRERNRAVFARGNWRAPFRYTQFRTGARIPRPLITQRYWILDPWRYRLPAGRKNQHWVRHYNDVLFVDVYRGVVLRVIPNFFW